MSQITVFRIFEEICRRIQENKTLTEVQQTATTFIFVREQIPMNKENICQQLFLDKLKTRDFICPLDLITYLINIVKRWQHPGFTSLVYLIHVLLTNYTKIRRQQISTNYANKNHDIVHPSLPSPFCLVNYQLNYRVKQSCLFSFQSYFLLSYFLIGQFLSLLTNDYCHNLIIPSPI